VQASGVLSSGASSAAAQAFHDLAVFSCDVAGPFRRALLQEGYSVLFLHRDGSRIPFLHAAHEALNTAALCTTPSGQAAARFSALRVTSQALSSLHAYAADGRLLSAPFTTVQQYLELLETATRASEREVGDAMVVLAAAVSDFHVPDDALADHKIQSSNHDEGLTLHLAPVPKRMRRLKAEWAPSCYLVSFKLETDPDVLMRKAAAALEKHRCDVVVANLLQQRYSELHVMTTAYPAQEGGDADVWRPASLANTADPEAEADEAARSSAAAHPGVQRAVHWLPAASLGQTTTSASGGYAVTDLIARPSAPAGAAGQPGRYATPPLERALAHELVRLHAGRTAHK
jgi:phosphopantothenate-cysteine ligase